MRDAMLVLLLFGLVSIGIGVILYRKDRMLFKEFEQRLSERETALYEFYRGVEDMIKELKLCDSGKAKDLEPELFEAKDSSIFEVCMDPDDMIKCSSNKTQQVMDLLDMKISETKIASLLKMGLGEVNLIASIYHRRAKHE